MRLANAAIAIKLSCDFLEAEKLRNVCAAPRSSNWKFLGSHRRTVIAFGALRRWQIREATLSPCPFALRYRAGRRAVMNSIHCYKINIDLNRFQNKYIRIFTSFILPLVLIILEI